MTIRTSRPVRSGSRGKTLTILGFLMSSLPVVGAPLGYLQAVSSTDILGWAFDPMAAEDHVRVRVRLLHEGRSLFSWEGLASLAQRGELFGSRAGHWFHVSLPELRGTEGPIMVELSTFSPESRTWGARDLGVIEGSGARDPIEVVNVQVWREGSTGVVGLVFGLNPRPGENSRVWVTPGAGSESVLANGIEGGPMPGYRARLAGPGSDGRHRDPGESETIILSFRVQPDPGSADRVLAGVVRAVVAGERPVWMQGHAGGR